MSAFKRLIFLLSTVLFILSCSSNTGYKPAFTGQQGELIIVCSNTWWKNDSLRNTLLNTLQVPYPNLPQAEPIFNIAHYTENNLNQLLERHRNILWFKEEVVVSTDVQKDVNASEQLIISVNAPDVNEALLEYQKQANNIISAFENKELERIKSKANSQANKDFKALLDSTLGFSLAITKDFKIIKKGADFVYFRRERTKKLSGTSHFVIDGIFAYTYPYTSDSTFTEGFQNFQRKKYLAPAIFGREKANYYVNQTVIPPVFDTLNFNGGFSTKMSGLWRLKNEFLGGPFVSYAFLNKDQTKVITIEAYLMALKFDKREYMKDLEGIIATFKE